MLGGLFCKARPAGVSAERGRTLLFHTWAAFKYHGNSVDSVHSCAGCPTGELRPFHNSFTYSTNLTTFFPPGTSTGDKTVRNGDAFPDLMEHAVQERRAS